MKHRVGGVGHISRVMREAKGNRFGVGEIADLDEECEELKSVLSLRYIGEERAPF